MWGLIIIYQAVNKHNGKVYTGLTTTSLKQRIASHKCSAKGEGAGRVFINSLRKHGLSSFTWREMRDASSLKELQFLEKVYIAFYSRYPNYNMTLGGEGNPVREIKESTKVKLRLARQGKQPFLGMKHTDANKELFANVSRAYWNQQKVFNPYEICSLYFRDASKKFGISKTHYYRLKKSLTNPPDRGTFIRRR